MKTFDHEEDAYNESVNSQKIFISKLCPYSVKMSTRSICGDWCPHFFVDKDSVYITCSGAEVAIGNKE
jgi:SUMO ligase MMS21 Smc5/6 complex component